MNPLENRTLIITGASRGIGRALAVELAGRHVNLILNARSATALQETAELCESPNVRVDSVVGDAAAVPTAQTMLAKALQIGNFFGFVHNAGVAAPGPKLWDLPAGKFAEVLATNLVAGFQLIKLAGPQLLGLGNGIAVFVGSGAAEMAIPGLAAYCVAKAAEEHLARQFAAEAPQITSFAFRPGTVDTFMQQQAREVEGPGSKTVRPMFQGIKDRGELISPETAAKALANIMTDNPRRFQGRVATVSDG